ncbi:MAG: hemolysin family protein [Thermoanaerobaculia bacterium]|nr:hemolysin family protein [Thermoanaerobaculia bacterium]
MDLLTLDARAWQPDLLVRYLLQVALLFASALFSGSETALFSLTPVDMRHLRRQRHKRAETLHSLIDEPRKLIVSLLCGNEMVNIAAVANMTAILIALFGEQRAGWLSLFIMLPLLLLIGEVTPKTIAVTDPRRVAADIVAAPMAVWVRVVAPLRWVVRWVSDRITTRLVGPQRTREHILQVDEFRSLVEDVAETGHLGATAHALINQILAASAAEIVTIMTPRSRVAFLDADQPLRQILEAFKVLRHPRVPIYRGDRDHLIGFLHVEDVLRLSHEGVDLDALSVDEIVHAPVVVPLTKRVDEMFDFFRRHQAHAAAVLNEFGGVAGFITMQDVLNMIFGELVGGSDAQTAVREVSPDVYEAPGDIRLSDLNRLTGFGIQDARMTTIAGVAFRHLDRLPEVGDVVELGQATITVLEMDAHRISRVRVGRGRPAGDDDGRQESPEAAT